MPKKEEETPEQLRQTEERMRAHAEEAKKRNETAKPGHVFKAVRSWKGAGMEVTVPPNPNRDADER
jgi:hypothetical protein